MDSSFFETNGLVKMTSHWSQKQKRISTGAKITLFHFNFMHFRTNSDPDFFANRDQGLFELGL